MQCAEDLQRAWSELCALLERICAARGQLVFEDQVDDKSGCFPLFAKQDYMSTSYNQL